MISNTTGDMIYNAFATTPKFALVFAAVFLLEAGYNYIALGNKWGSNYEMERYYRYKERAYFAFLTCLGLLLSYFVLISVFANDSGWITSMTWGVETSQMLIGGSILLLAALMSPLTSITCSSLAFVGTLVLLMAQ